MIHCAPCTRKILKNLGSCNPQRPMYGPKVIEDGDSDAQATVCENFRGWC